MIRHTYYKVEYIGSHNYNTRRPYVIYHSGNLEKAIEFMKNPKQDRFRPFDPTRLQLVKYTEEIIDVR